MKKKPNKIIAGWKELVHFPQWGIRNLPAKLDTGAKGSALDVKDIKHLSGDKVRFDIVLHRHDRDYTKHITADILKVTKVKSSNGEIQERIKVLTPVKIGPYTQDIEISLVCRKNMICRMLLGRIALQEHFFVDSSKTYLLEKRKKTSTTSSH